MVIGEFTVKRRTSSWWTEAIEILLVLAPGTSQRRVIGIHRIATDEAIVAVQVEIVELLRHHHLLELVHIHVPVWTLIAEAIERTTIRIEAIALHERILVSLEVELIVVRELIAPLELIVPDWALVVVLPRVHLVTLLLMAMRRTIVTEGIGVTISIASGPLLLLSLLLLLMLLLLPLSLLLLLLNG